MTYEQLSELNDDADHSYQDLDNEINVVHTNLSLGSQIRKFRSTHQESNMEALEVHEAVAWKAR